MRKNVLYVINGIVINLSNVSTIKVVDDRLIFNMNYCIKKNGNVIPDYIYVNDYSEEDLARLYSNEYFNEEFLDLGDNRFLNYNSISSYKYDEENKRYIINLSNAKSYEITKRDTNGNITKKEHRVMAEFVYYTGDKLGV